MSKQFRVYLLPLDIEMLMSELRTSVGLQIIQEAAPSSRPVELESPIRRRSAEIKSIDAVSVRCYLAPPCGADLRVSYYAKQDHWQVDHTSEVIEFSGCDYGDDVLFIGRFYFQNDILLDDTIWPKRPEFVHWADKMFRKTKKSLRRSKDLDAYIGEAADNFRRSGGRFASSMRRSGELVYDKAF